MVEIENKERNATARKIGETSSEEVKELKFESPQKKERKSGKKGGKIAIIAVICVALAGGGYFAYDYFFQDVAFADSSEEVIVDRGTFFDGVKVLGVDLSGKTMEEGRAEVAQVASEQVAEGGFTYTVNGESFSLTAQDLGQSVNVDEALNKAMLFGREGDYPTRKSQVDDAKANGYEVQAPVMYNKETVLSALSANDAKLNIAPVEAAVEMNKISDEDKLITKMEVTYTDSVVGQKVDINKLAEDIIVALGEGKNTIDVQAEIAQPTLTTENIAEKYTKMGTYKTEYKTSAEGRRYNIWKMGDIINGVKIMPGDTWSINDEAGPRTYERGWKGAPGISEGMYKEEAGGGICQTSSTLYNAVLRAEVKIADRTHHSWPLTYVPDGLDATISTGKPDFKITNNYDVPIYIIVDCSGQDGRYIEVSILGPPLEDGLTRDFSSKVISTFGGGGERVIQNPALPAGARRVVQGAHIGKKVEVYKHWLDKDGNEVKKELYYTDTYSAFPAVVEVGSAAPVWEEPAVAAPPVETPPTPEAPAPPPEVTAPNPEVPVA